MGRTPRPAEVRTRFFIAQASGATLREATAAAGVSEATGIAGSFNPAPQVKNAPVLYGPL
jgi:hypothetical protein